MAATDQAKSTSSRLFLQDDLTKVWYLVDTGSDVTAVPATAEEMKKGPIKILYAANGTPIRVYGEKLMLFKLGLRREFKWPILIAELENAIIGADFLEHFDLSPDLKRKQLKDNTTGLCANGQIRLAPVIQIKVIQEDSKWFKYVQKYPGIANPLMKRKPKISHTVTHTIETHGRPVFAKARRLPPEKYQAAKLIF